MPPSVMFRTALHRTTVVAALLMVVTSCAGKDAPDSGVPPTEPVASTLPATTELKALSAFPVGIEAYVDILDFPVPRARAVNSFDRYRAPQVYWSQNQAVRGTFDFAVSDKFLAFAMANGMTAHGTSIVYFQDGASPAYVNRFSGTRAEFETMVQTFIETIVTRYRGKVEAWDVVNEMLGDVTGRDFYNATMAQFYRTDAEYVAFIEQCFRWAHAADPAAKLFYNEALLELPDGRRLNAVLRMVATLKSHGAPIDGIGTQMHTDVSWPQAAIDTTLAQLAATGLLIHISELDVSVNTSFTQGQNFAFTSLTTALAEQQRAKYRTIVQSYRKRIPSSQQWGITVWDMLDPTSWLNKYRTEWPCLFDGNGDKKPAFYGFAEGLLTP
jgi:endo-1,4-beta-xylanase